MIHHQDSNWGLVMSVDAGMKEREGGRGGEALAGHADTIPTALATLAMGRQGWGWGRETVGMSGIDGVVGWGCLALTSCF